MSGHDDDPPPESTGGRVKPLLIAYLDGDFGTPAMVAGRRRLLENFARREGYALGDVFVEKSSGSDPQAALTVMIEAVRRKNPGAIAVPSLDDLGPTAREQQELRKRIYTSTGLRILIVEAVNRTPHASDTRHRRATSSTSSPTSAPSSTPTGDRAERPGSVHVVDVRAPVGEATDPEEAGG